MRVPACLLATSLAVLAAGCSISESISKSVSSPFEWSSDSSVSSGSSSRTRANYVSDVRDYTQAYVKSGGGFDGFTRGLSDLAAKHGVSNWEADTDTYVGIGQGLKKAGATQMQVDVWATNLAKGDANKAAAVQKGYDSYHP